ncbi:unnamed protein product [Onchocerca ochengi]|uniref:Cystatin domain-containing protein n=1 Tax=Onchocerca ochengi TaxID=42157 RepID=A0A182ER71_ONCOC|nr:unnamed protein product [Onchocerca ochengi]
MATVVLSIYQYVDIYAKIETERLVFIRLNQNKLLSEECIHLREAVVNDGDTTNVGRLFCNLHVQAVYVICMTVVHLAINLENRQRVYFTAANVQQIAPNPPAKSLTAFFTLCQTDAFAKTLLCSKVPTHCMWNASRKSFERSKLGEPVDGQPGK